MSSLTDTMKCMVDQIKGLQERLNIMESEKIPAISSPQSILVSTFQTTASSSGNWRDTYDPFGSNILNPLITGASAAEGNVSMAHELFSFHFMGFIWFIQNSNGWTDNSSGVRKWRATIRTGRCIFSVKAQGTFWKFWKFIRGWRPNAPTRPLFAFEA